MSGGARYETMIDGVGRTNRDTREIAIEAGQVLKADNPNPRVVIRDRNYGRRQAGAGGDVTTQSGAGPIAGSCGWSASRRYAQAPRTQNWN